MAYNAAIKALLYRVLRWCGAAAFDETPSTLAEDLAEAELIDMLRAWDIDDKLALRVRETKSINAGTSSIAIGTGQTWDTERPSRIIFARLKNAESYTYPLGIMSEAEYNALTDKVTAVTPTGLYYDGSYANGTIYLSNPTDVAYVLEMTSQKTLYSMSGATGYIDSAVPPEYWDAMNLCLRLRVDGYFEKKATQLDAMLAEQALNRIRYLNSGPAPTMQPIQGEIL